MILLRNADVFAPEPLGRSDVLVAGGQIVAVAPRIEPPSWPVEVIDLHGARLVPAWSTRTRTSPAAAGRAARTPRCRPSG